MLTTEEKQAIIKEHARHEGDTGSPEVQIAVLTTRIAALKIQQERPSFPSRSAENGWSASWPAELSAEKRHRTVSRNYCQTEYP